VKLGLTCDTLRGYVSDLVDVYVLFCLSAFEKYLRFELYWNIFISWVLGPVGIGTKLNVPDKTKKVKRD
jgi:hypothetical protein